MLKARHKTIKIKVNKINTGGGRRDETSELKEIQSNESTLITLSVHTLREIYQR